MYKSSVFCIVFSRLQADQIVQRLRAAAFSAHDISILFASGPMIAALGDMTQGFMNQGVPLNKARLYEVSVKEGHTLVSVLAETEDRKRVAEDIFSKSGGNDICLTEGASASHEVFSNPDRVQMTGDRVGVA